MSCLRTRQLHLRVDISFLISILISFKERKKSSYYPIILMLLFVLFDCKIRKESLCLRLYNCFYNVENLWFLFYLFCQVYQEKLSKHLPLPCHYYNAYSHLKDVAFRLHNVPLMQNSLQNDLTVCHICVMFFICMSQILNIKTQINTNYVFLKGNFTNFTK